MHTWYNVGKIVNTHGIKGEVRVISKTDFPEVRYMPGNELFLFMPGEKKPMTLKVATHRVHKNFDLLTFDGYHNVNEVEKMKNGILKIHEEQLTPLENNEYYFHEIIGLLVFTVDGEEIGKITEILTPGANDVWVVKGKNGKEVYIPYIEQIVKQVNISEKMVIIEPMDGLLS